MLFPIVVLLGLTGLVVGILNVHDHFTIPAIAPLVWNLVIIAGMVGLAPLFEGDNQLYAYAIGVVAGTLVQLLMMLPTLRRMGFPIGHIRLPRRDDERVRRVLLLMLPVSIGLGLININLLLNTVIGFGRLRRGAARDRRRLPDLHAPAGDVPRRGRDRAVPAARPAGRARRLRGHARHDRRRMRQIGLLLIPAGAAMAVLAEPIVRLVFERGEWDAESTALTADALFWFAFSLPFSGWVLMLTRGFFSLQQPLTPTKLAVGSLAINAVGSYLLSKPFGIAGIVLGTIASNVALVLAEAVLLRRALGGFETRETLVAVAKMLVGAGVLAAVSYGVWYGLDALLGDALIAQIVSVFTALALGSVAYAGVVLGLQIPEARQILDLFARRLRRRS